MCSNIYSDQTVIALNKASPPASQNFSHLGKTFYTAKHDFLYSQIQLFLQPSKTFYAAKHNSLYSQIKLRGGGVSTKMITYNMKISA